MSDKGIELSQGIKQLNPVPTSVWDVREDFFGTGPVSAEDAEVLIANSLTWAHEGKRIYDKESKAVYVISGVSADPLKWEMKLLGDNISYDQIQIINKFSESLGDVYYDGVKLLTTETIPTDITHAFIIPDGSSQLTHLTYNLGNLTNTGWNTIPSGTYVMTANGEVFAGTPFTRQAGETYRVLIQHTQKDGIIIQTMHIYTTDSITGNNNSIYHRVGTSASAWIKSINETEVDAKIDAAVGEGSASAHSHDSEVMNIEELLVAYNAQDPEWGIAQSERTHGKVIWVKNYNEANYSDVSNGIGQLLVFKGWDLITDWATISKWEKIESVVGDEIELIPAGGVLTIPLGTQKWMTATLTSATTIAVAGAATNVGRTLLIDITGSEHLDATGLNVLGGDIEETKIQVTIVVRSSTEIRSWIENIPA